MIDPDIVVFRDNVHGMDPADYADAVRERLSDREVAVAATPRAERDLLDRAPVATGVSIDESLVADAAGLELFQCMYAGTGHLPLDALRERGVAVTSASGVHGPNVAEYVLGQILVFTRRLDEGWRRQQRREWRHYRAGELQGSTVTVVGLGAIGQAVTQRLQGFGVETVGVRYTPEKGGPTDEVIGFGDDALHDAYARTDYLVLACPLTDTTRGLVDADALDTLPGDAAVVNVARGPVVDTDDLVAALRTNAIRGAALDVTDPEPLPADHPLWNFETVHVTPHNAGHTPRYFDRLADILAENVRHAEDGGYDDLRNQVL
jgi:phosphoglycerate dehydrogenase-like enzyme